MENPAGAVAVPLLSILMQGTFEIGLSQADCHTLQTGEGSQFTIDMAGAVVADACKSLMPSTV